MILAIDTATLDASVALVTREGQLRASRQARVTTHSEALLGMIAAVLEEAGVRPDDLAAVACGAGPGSFTGLRIGLATAKGLCLAVGSASNPSGRRLPLLLVSSLQALARRAPASMQGALVVPCIDAFKSEVYVGFYRGGDEPAPAGTPVEAVLPPQQLIARLAALPAGSPLCIVGGGPVRYPELRALDALFVEGGAPVADEVGRLAAMRLARGEADDLAAAVPRYIRPSEAEIKFGPALE